MRMQLFTMFKLQKTLIQYHNLASVTTMAYPQTTKKQISVD
jgi:hypothetical protein